MNNKGTATTGGTSVLTLLTVLFVGLKLTHFIDWDWKWVLAPIWAPGLFLLAVLMIVFAFMAFTKANKK